MGLAEHIRAGALLSRENVVILDTFGSGSGSVNAGGTYGVLGIITSQECRLRLYDTEESRDNLQEVNRPFGAPLPSSSISLIADFSMSVNYSGSYSVTNAGASSYTFTGDVNASNPTLTLIRGNRYEFNINASGHPFWIQSSSGGYDVSSVYNTGITNNGTQSGTLIFQVSSSAPNTLYYYCQNHPSMGGRIDIINQTPIINTLFNVDPVKFGHATNIYDPKMYWRIDPAQTGSRVIVVRNLLEDLNIQPQNNTFYREANRRVISASATVLQPFAGVLASGSVSTFNTPTTPATFMLISASLTGPGGGAAPGYLLRFRMYASSSALYDNAEKTRPFSTEPSENAYLIVDMLMSGSEVINFVPKIFGANLKNMGKNLVLIKDDAAKLKGQNEIYYIMENLTYLQPGGGTDIDPQVNLYLYALED